jgi:DNA-binding transcriptional ArsR family regulator
VAAEDPLVPFYVSDGLARPESSSEGVRVLLGLAQPQVSKHLRVLRDVGLVEADLQEGA